MIEEFTYDNETGLNGKVAVSLYVKRFIIFCALIFALIVPLFAQTDKTKIVESNIVESGEKVSYAASAKGYAFLPDPQMAMSTVNYPVTAGDVYLLGFIAGSDSVEYPIVVDSTYKIKVANFGVLDVAGKTYLETKSQVESIVSRNYPLSGVHFVLKNPAVFTVIVKGEVTKTSELSAWGLSRLSSVIDPVVTEYASNRDVTITSASGKSKTYDLFRATRMGDQTQNPYVRPGDVITVKHYTRLVTISGGAVERPGTYQLRDGEGLADLIAYYGHNLTPLADTSRIELTRHIGSENVAGDKIYLDETAIKDNYNLQHYDSVYIPEIIDFSPVMFVEGAVGISAAAKLDSSNRVIVRFTKGENYASLVRRNMEWFTPVSDTSQAYILRGEEKIPISLNPMLYDASYRSQYYVEESDTLIIPFRQYFVSVSGAVSIPGRYPYIPDRGWDYYIALAGGFNPAMNNFDSVTITDLNGKRLKKSDPITPETNIKANSNVFPFYFNQYASIVTTILTVITSFITVLAYTKTL